MKYLEFMFYFVWCQKYSLLWFFFFLQHVKSMMHRECKCHGMSGSCTVKTCFMKLSRFRDIGNSLKAKFDGASRVMIGNDGHNRMDTLATSGTAAHQNLQPYNPDHKPPTIDDLVYFDRSPDFCTRNRRLGIKGTAGRQCNDTSLGTDGCDLMCCGRGHTSQVIEEEKRCSCTFHWCCQVKCKICRFNRTVHTCLWWCHRSRNFNGLSES